jgi:hypothetical protein
MQKSSKPTIDILILEIIFLLLSGWGTLRTILDGQYLATVIVGLIFAWIAYDIVAVLRQGFRQQDHFEKFEIRQLFRFILVLFGGLLLMLLSRLVMWPGDIEPTKIMVGLIGMSIWLVFTTYSASRLRGRRESKAAYQRRLDYKEPE